MFVRYTGLGDARSVMMRVLVVEDDRRISSLVRRGLEEEGYAVDVSHDGEDGQYMAEAGDYDVIVLDIMLPLRDGLRVCANLRARRIATPLLMLTAKDTVTDRVVGLDTGADDYLVKPFAFDELLARVRALLRRDGAMRSPQLRVGDLVMDTLTREVRRGGRSIELTAKEYAILEYLMRNPNVVVTRTMIEVHAWDAEFSGGSNVIDVYVSRLRVKLDDGDGRTLIQTVRGAGYRMRAP